MIRPLLLVAMLLTTPAAAQNAPAPAPAPAATQDSAPPLEVDVTGGISAPMPIAIPYLPTPQAVSTAAGQTDALGRQLADIVASDLRSSGLFTPLPASGLRTIGVPEVTAPTYPYWTGTGAQALMQGYVKANGDGSLTVGCYLYDVAAQSELTRLGFVVAPADWRRAAHKCSDMIYRRLTGEGAYLDSRVVYVSETGPKGARIKRLAIMDLDGANHRFLTAGASIVMTPRFSPDGRQIVYMSYIGRNPAIYVLDPQSGQQHLVTAQAATTFAPHFSPDGKWILYSRAEAGNTDLWRVAAAGGGAPQRLTNSPGIDTGGSYSPDGSKIVFESDRSGGQQLYVMNADGSNQQRISFGGGRYATPAWSPRGDLIAFTKIAGAFRIGVMTPGGQNERLLTNSWQDEAPSWAPNGRALMFFRTGQGRTGKAEMWTVDLTGSNERQVKTPLDGSDPSWGPVQP